MSKKSIKILGITTGVVLFLILLSWLYSFIFDDSSSAQGRVFPDLIDKTNDISQISIKTADNTLTFVKGEKHWALEEKYNYPVSVETLQALLLGMADLRYLEEKTSKPERYQDIGVEDITAPDAKSKLIQLSHQDQSIIAEVLVGRQMPAQGLAADTASFIRKPSEATSWMVDGLKPISDNFFDWIDRRLLTIPASDIQQVELRPFITAATEPSTSDKSSKSNKKPKGPEPAKPLILKRATKEDRDFKIENLPAKAKIKTQAEVNTIANSLFNLEFLDVLPASALDNKSWTQTAIFQDFNGKTVTIDLVDASKAKITIPQDHVHAEEGENHGHDHDKETSKDGEKSITPAMEKGYWAKITIQGDTPTPHSLSQEKTKDWIFLIPQETGDKLGTKIEKLVD